MELKDKIEKLILGLGLTSTRFADFIDVKRPIISHILSGRNRPSLEIIQKIVSAFPDLGYNWISDDEDLDLVLVNKIADSNNFHDLFHSSRELDENKSNEPEVDISNSHKDVKKIQKIVVFYTDNTFQQFDPS